MRVSALWCVCVVGLGLVAPAVADQEPLPLGALDEPGQAAIDPVDLRKRADASVDQSLVFASAETLYAGEVAWNSYQVLGLGLSYGITDRIELSATTVLPFILIGSPLIALSGKFQLVRTPRLLFSVQATAGGVTPSRLWDIGAGALGLNLLMDIVLDRDGDVALSFTSQNWMGFATGEHLSAAFALTGAFHARVAKVVKLMCEVVVSPAAWLDDEQELDEAATILNYGARFFWQSFSFDVSFLLPIHPAIVDHVDVFVIGVPYLTFSGRF